MPNVRLKDVLEPNDIILDVEETSLATAVMKTAELLRERPEVKNWHAVSQQLNKDADKSWQVLENGVCIPHVRTSDVSDLVVSVCRLAGTIHSPTENQDIKHIFILAVPHRLSAEYLRVVGSIARVFKNGPTVARLGLAPTPAAYLRILEAEESRVS